jgi:hypothetical protein
VEVNKMVNLRIILALTAIVLILLLPGIITASDMTSTSFTSSNTAISGGGLPAASTSYNTNSTVGQSTPLMDPQDPPFSDGFDLFPGFWYTVAAVGRTCPGDDNGDKDVEGADLAAYAAGAMTIGWDALAADFGRTDCP